MSTDRTPINAGAFVLTMDAPAWLGVHLERHLLANMAHRTIDGLYVEVPRSVESLVQHLEACGFEVRAVRRTGSPASWHRHASPPRGRPRTQLRNRRAPEWLPTLGAA